MKRVRRLLLAAVCGLLLAAASVDWPTAPAAESPATMPTAPPFDVTSEMPAW